MRAQSAVNLPALRDLVARRPDLAHPTPIGLAALAEEVSA